MMQEMLLSEKEEGLSSEEEQMIVDFWEDGKLTGLNRYTLKQL